MNSGVYVSPPLTAARPTPIRDRLRALLNDKRAELRGLLVNEVGLTDADAAEVVSQIGDGKLLAWLLVHGPDLLKLLIKLLGL